MTTTLFNTKKAALLSTIVAISWLLATSYWLLTASAITADGPATLSLTPGSLDLNRNDTRTLTLELNTAGRDTTGADVIINYNSDIITITQVVFTSPELYFHNIYTTDTANPQTSTLKLTSTFTNPSDSFNGFKTYAHITIKGKSGGDTNLNFKCNPGATNDTNIAEKSSASDIIDCNSLPSIPIHVNSQTSTTSTSTSTTTTTTAIGGTTNSNNDTTCTPPTRPTGLNATRVDNDTIKLAWTRSSSANNYSLFYGLEPGNYIYGAANFGNTNQLLVNFLNPNTTYYFALAGVNDCSTSSTVTTSASTKSPTTSTRSRSTTTTTTRPTPTPTPSPTPITSTYQAAQCRTCGGSTSIACQPGLSCALVSGSSFGLCIPASQSSTADPRSFCGQPTPKPSASPSPTPQTLAPDDIDDTPSLDNLLSQTQSDRTSAPADTVADEPIPEPEEAPEDSGSNPFLIALAILAAIVAAISLILFIRSRREPDIPPSPPPPAAGLSSPLSKKEPQRTNSPPPAAGLSSPLSKGEPEGVNSPPPSSTPSSLRKKLNTPASLSEAKGHSAVPPSSSMPRPRSNYTSPPKSPPPNLTNTQPH